MAEGRLAVRPAVPTGWRAAPGSCLGKGNSSTLEAISGEVVSDSFSPPQDPSASGVFLVRNVTYLWNGVGAADAKFVESAAVLRRKKTVARRISLVALGQCGFIAIIVS